MTVPGVGPVTSLTFKAGVDDADRFRSSRTVAAHFGLTPRRYQSGETDNPGRISKAGDRDVRMALYTAAHALMTRSDAWSTLKAWGAAARQGPWPSSRRRRGGPQAGGDPAPDVGRRHRLPGCTAAGGRMS